MKKLTLLILVFILAAYSAGAPSEFDRNLQKWVDAGISHYRFSPFIGCFCPFGQDMPLTIEVQNNQAVSMTYSDGTRVPDDDPQYAFFDKYATIDRIFSELESGLEGEADEVTAVYDTTYGYPTQVNFDFIKNAIDDELGLTVSNFEVLQ